jgi:hypothetical protein
MEQPQDLTHPAFNLRVVGVLSDACQEGFTIFDTFEIGNVNEILDIGHEGLFVELIDGRKHCSHLINFVNRINFIMIAPSQSSSLAPQQLSGTLEMRYGVREVALGERLLYAVITTNEHFLIIDLLLSVISVVIRRSAYPRVARLSPCERFLIASFTDNSVFLYDTRYGN